jgi:tRNA A-37 threonylcarbamoyl transferase component Bud32
MPDRTAERLIADRYALEAPIGQGGMGVVWRARDNLLGREVAIKEVRVPPTVPDSERDSMRARVLREARAAARLNHPGAVTLYDVINEQGHAFIVMELIHAPTLAEVVSGEGPLDPCRAARIGLQVAGALAAAHLAGIVHRDVKPANVMVAGETARLTDFGIARVQGDPKLTSTGLIVGSPAYMAPEQASGEAAGPAADLWSLGATLYYALEGHPPFERGSSIATLAAVVNDPPRPTRRAGALGPIVAALLSKSPEDRPSALELRDQLERVLAAEGESTAVRAGMPPEDADHDGDRGDAGPADPDPADSAGPGGPPGPVPRPSGADQPVEVAPLTATLVGHPALDPAADRADTTDRQRVPPAVWARPARSRLPGRLWISVAVVVVVAVVATTLALSGVFSRERGDGTSARRGPSTGSAPSASGPNSGPSAGGSGQSRVPPGWTSLRREDGGYAIAYPRDWRPTNSSRFHTTDVHGPGGLLIRVQSSDHPNDPMKTFIQQERAFAHDHAGDGYRRISLGPGRYGERDAAVWEFSYILNGERVRARDVTFKSPDGHWGYAILLRSPERGWNAAVDVGLQFERSFTALG